MHPSLTAKKRPRKLPYQRLDPGKKEIRLLILTKADNQSDDIHCELRQTSLAKTPRPLYHTVSYVWGDVTAKSTIYLSGRRVEFGASAEQVLRRFRFKHRDRILWIDAVCINQSDVRERSQQIAMMDDIYSGSAHNLIWLGEDDGMMARALVALDAVVEDARRETQGFIHLRKMLRGDHADIRYAQVPLAVGNDVIDDVLLVYDTAWFQRLWGTFPARWRRLLIPQTLAK